MTRLEFNVLIGLQVMLLLTPALLVTRLMPILGSGGLVVRASAPDRPWMIQFQIVRYPLRWPMAYRPLMIGWAYNLGVLNKLESRWSGDLILRLSK